MSRALRTSVRTTQQTHAATSSLLHAASSWTSQQSPGPGGNFVEGRQALTLGVSANLQARWELDLAWTTFGGAGRFNDINDRDFIASSVKFSF